MSRTSATQNPYSMYDWSKLFAPNRCEVCGRPHAPAGSDWASQWYTNAYAPLMDNLTRMWGTMAQPWMTPATSAYAPLMDNLTRMWGNMAQTWTVPVPNPTWQGTGTRAHRHTHHHDCGCEHGDCDGCGGDHCHCRCCIADADLVVYARVGERRVVPLTIENPRRRERQVKLELSNWSSRGGRASNIKAQIAGPVEFTLAPCQEHETILVIDTTAATENGGNESDTRRNTPDVDDCQTFYADLRVEGCDMRPVRIALALLPRDCAEFRVDCGCSCC